MTKTSFLFVLLILAFACDPPRELISSKREINKGYKINGTKSYFLNRISFAHSFSKDSILNDEDSLFYLTYFVEDFNSYVTMSVKLIEVEDSLFIHLDSLDHYTAYGNIHYRISKTKSEFDLFSKDDLSCLFEKYCLQRLKSGKELDEIWYDNKKIYDKVLN